MELRLIHFYPDLMSLYGSYANLSVLKRYLESIGHTVRVDTVLPSQPADLSDAAFLYMGAGTERSQKAALADFTNYGDTIRQLAADGLPMLFAGTAMELLGSTITANDGTIYNGIGLADFTAAQESRRIVGDVYGHTDLFDAPVVGFMNKCTVITGIQTPLLTDCKLGFGNEQTHGPEGFHQNNVFGSELTGPLLVKNPRLLDAVADAVCRHSGAEVPETRPQFPYAEQGYAITAEQLKLRCQN